jgi:hypothetical protein
MSFRPSAASSLMGVSLTKSAVTNGGEALDAFGNFQGNVASWPAVA